MFTKQAMMRIAQMVYESDNYENVYKPVLEKYGIAGTYDRIHWIYRDDCDQIRKDLLAALEAKIKADDARRSTAYAVAHYHDD